MKRIEIDDDVYRYIAAQTKDIGESASDILRRLLNVTPDAAVTQTAAPTTLGTTTVVDAGDIFQWLEQQQLSSQKSTVDRFLVILSGLYQHHQNDFARVLELRGRNRVYFARSKEALLESGSSTNPKAVPESEYWVITNTNTSKKVSMLGEVLQALQYSEEDSQKITAFLN